MRDRDDELLQAMMAETEDEIFTEATGKDQDDNSYDNSLEQIDDWDGVPISNAELAASRDDNSYLGNRPLEYSRELELEQRVAELEAEINNNTTIVGIDQAQQNALARDQWWREQRRELEMRGVWNEEIQNEILIPREQLIQQNIQQQQILAHHDAAAKTRDTNEIVDRYGDEGLEALAAYSRMNPNSPFSQAIAQEINTAADRPSKVLEMYQRGYFGISDTGQEHPMMRQVRTQYAARRGAQDRHADYLFDRDLKDRGSPRWGSEDDIFNSIHTSDDEWSGFSHGRR